MKITVSNHLILENVPPQIDHEISARMTFKNPEWIENDRMGRWNGETSEYLTFYKRLPEGLTLPRGFTRQIIGLCNRRGIAYHIEDRRKSFPPVPFEFSGQLRRFQEKALTDIIARDFGTLSAPTGTGKTVIALAAIAKRRQPTLVIVHTKELMYQWRDRASQFLDLEEPEIGLIGDGKNRTGDRLTIGIVNSIYKMAERIRDRVGFLVVDEAHRTPARVFTEAVTAFDSRFMLGLSATPWRRDRLTRLISWHLGDLVYEVSREALQQQGHILKADIVWRETDFVTSFDPSEEYSRMLSELTQDPARNQLIAGDVSREARNGGGTCLVLTDRKEHAATLRDLLTGQRIDAALLTGDTPNHERKAIVDRLNEGCIKALCATGQLIGEGFDCRGLQTLFLATPIKFDGRVLQYLGRVLRPAPGKEKATIYDYVDARIGVLAASAESRQRVYANL
jgi:superfamily II DNA or RNA helicase